MGALPKDTSSMTMQVFTPVRTESVIADTPWVPGTTDKAFCVSVDCNMTIGNNTPVPVAAGTIRGILEETSYTFSIDQVIEVM